MVDLRNIKLIIWDLDETLWDGTLSEGDISLRQNNVELIKKTTDMGIVNSICSKNDFSIASDKLIKLGLWDYFVFPSINWEPKGKRVENIIKTMGLRAVNVLFVDDNIQNLQEAKYYLPELNIILDKDLTFLREMSNEFNATDIEHKRLSQYHQLEKKESSRQNYNSNDDFLKSCGIVVEIHDDCLLQLDRIHELIMRSNQLNYTKFRQSKDDLKALLSDESINTGYVTVKDKFGDYGTVGFFAIKNKRAIHYTFSCRTLGMLIEQYVYVNVGCPEIDVVGDVVTILDKVYVPEWINQSTGNNNESKDNINAHILIKGPCDMSQIFSFIQENSNIEVEFTYANDSGVLVEGHNSLSQTVTSLFATNDQKKQIISDMPFFDSNMLDSKISKNNFDFIILSLLPEGNLGVYRRKETGEMISICERYYDLTDFKNHIYYVNGDVFTSNINFTDNLLKEFADKYEFVDNSDATLTIESLNKIYNFLNSNTRLILLLGSEREYKGAQKNSYIGRHIFHKTINDRIRVWAADKSNVILLSFDNFAKSENDFLDTINHFKKKVYYDLAKELTRIINEEFNSFKAKGKFALYFSIFKQKTLPIRNKIRNLFKN